MFGAGSTSTSRNPNFDSVLETFAIFCEIPSVKRRTTYHGSIRRLARVTRSFGLVSSLLLSVMYAIC
jgi:hypothetical protein